MDVVDVVAELNALEETLLDKTQQVRRLRTFVEKSTADGQLGGFLSPEEVAKLFQVDVAQVHALARSGKIPSVKVGKYRRFSQKKLKRWSEQ